jgi:hypothetical protein
MARRTVLVAVLMLAALGVGGARSAIDVVGGTAVQVQAAPWAVYVQTSVGGGLVLDCSGSILDSLHVLTAAHCLYDQAGNLMPPTMVGIRAGISNVAQPLGTDAEQDRAVSSLRVHPGYTPSENAGPDDVAVLALNAPLDLSGSAVQAISLPSPGGAFPAGSSVTFAGFGQENPSAQPDGSLNSLTATVDQQGTCGPQGNDLAEIENAIAFCAVAPTASICSGDSGSGAVTTTGSRMLVGMAEGSPTGCGTGTHDVYTYLGAPEILSFIQGNNQPPTAPRLDQNIDVDLTYTPPFAPGGTVQCADDSAWAGGAPTSRAYAFVDARGGTVLQQGTKTTYLLRPEDVGAEILCRVFATNAGGTAVADSATSIPVAAAPTPKLGIAPVSGVMLVAGRPAFVRVVLRPSLGLHGKFSVCVTPPASVAARACASANVTAGGSGDYPLAVTLQVKPTAKAGVAHVAITAGAGAEHASASAVLRVVRR